jgi:hypothetical protein
MTEEIIQSMSLNKILVALLEEHGMLSVPTTRFVEAASEMFKFKFSLRSKNE